MNEKQIIAQRIAKEISNGDVVNLGIGLPTMVADYLADDITAYFQSENGFIGLKAFANEDEIDPDFVNAGGVPVTVTEDCAFFDSATSFAIIRGGHVDVTVLGGLQVDEEGNLANYMVPGKMVPGMGGAMDLVSGVKNVIIGMNHTAKGAPKILKKCTLPLTGSKVVNMIVTEFAVFKMIDSKLTLTELREGTTLEDIKAITEAEFAVSETLGSF